MKKRCEGGLCPPSRCILYFMYDNILIDGKNIAYRAAAASRAGGYETHAVTIMIRMLDRFRRTFKPSKWHIFWDVPKYNLWRKDIYPKYKDGRPTPDQEYAKCLKDSQRVAIQVFRNMAMNQYIRQKNEADDLIYAFVKAFSDKNNIIVIKKLKNLFLENNSNVQNATRQNSETLNIPNNLVKYIMFCKS